MKPFRVAALTLLMLVAGCAVLPVNTTAELKAPVAERDMLAEAVLAVEKAPWPKPEKVSLMARITGGGDTTTRSDAIAAYLAGLNPEGARFTTLRADARANLNAAQALNLAALDAMDAPLLSMNDVALVERAIKSLREHRDIYVIAAKEIAKSGERVDDEAIDALRNDYRAAIRTLGELADLLADHISSDGKTTFAAPDRHHHASNFSDL